MIVGLIIQTKRDGKSVKHAVEIDFRVWSKAILESEYNRLGPTQLTFLTSAS